MREPYQNICLLSETEEKTNKEGNRLNSCPLVEIPEHGRLIDADKLKEKFGGKPLVNVHHNICSIFREIDNAPTVIEAEEGINMETAMSVVKSCVKCKDCYVLDYGTVCACLDDMIPRDVDINKEVYGKCPKIGTDTSNEYWKELVQLRKENEFLTAQIMQYKKACSVALEATKEIRDKTVDLLAELCI
jgi:hypothetical protein